MIDERPPTPNAWESLELFLNSLPGDDSLLHPLQSGFDA